MCKIFFNSCLCVCVCVCVDVQKKIVHEGTIFLSAPNKFNSPKYKTPKITTNLWISMSGIIQYLNKFIHFIYIHKAYYFFCYLSIWDFVISIFQILGSREKEKMSKIIVIMFEFELIFNVRKFIVFINSNSILFLLLFSGYGVEDAIRCKFGSFMQFWLTISKLSQILCLVIELSQKYVSN